MGTASFSDSSSIGGGLGNPTRYVDVNYSEDYDSTTNKTKVTLTSVQTKCSVNYGAYRGSGIVEFAGTNVKTFSSSGEMRFSDSWSTISNSSGGYVYVTHSADGTASLTITLEENEYTGWFGINYTPKSRRIGIGTPDSVTVNLTTHTQLLTVDPNGGTWSGSTSIKTFRQAPTTTKTIANPTRSGYTFNGWKKTGGGSISGTTYTYGGTDCTLQAQWTRNTYSITYNANGGSGAPSSATVNTGDSYTISTTKPTRTNYTFLGWSTSSSATSATYSSGQSITPTGNMTLYAVWKRITYTIIYNANSGSGAPSSATVNAGDSYTISSTRPTRTNYTFLGWNTNSSATIASYQPSGSITPTGNMTLYAIWKRITYTITYNANSGSGAPSSATVNAGDSYTISTTKPTRTNYTFLGWSTSSSATSASYSSGQSITPTGNMTLYAVWKRIQYTITYSANSGSGAPSSATVNAGDSYTISSTVPTRTGYTFLGWSTNSSATSATYSSGQSITPTGNMTLYAIWRLNSYTLTISGDAHSIITVKKGSTTLSNGATIYYGDTLTITISASTGYKVSSRSPSGNSVTVTSNVTVSATTSPMATIHLRKTGAWGLYLIYIRKNAQWTLYQANIRKSGSWAKYF